jgi:hypothetical protein
MIRILKNDLDSKLSLQFEELIWVDRNFKHKTN